MDQAKLIKKLRTWGARTTTMSKFLALLSALLGLTTMALAAPTKTGRLEVNSVNYYYEVHGKEIGSRPNAASAAAGMTKKDLADGATKEPRLSLLLLHGSMGSIDMFGPLLPTLAKTRNVIVVDLHGHGRIALGERPFSLQAMGDDMAAIVKRLGNERVDVMGYSMGGGAAFRMAVQQPHSVRRLVIVSAGYSDEGFYPELVKCRTPWALRWPSR